MSVNFRSSAHMTALLQSKTSENGKTQLLLKITGIQPCFKTSRNLKIFVFLDFKSYQKYLISVKNYLPECS